MTKDEAFAVFERAAAEEYDRLGMDASPGSPNQTIARVMGRALLAVQNIQGREFSYTVTIGETARRLSAPSADELQSLIKQLMSAVSAERGFGLR